ncbi:MAG: hypothetical protein OER56_16700, partial [Hyphomicrobiales bacterium]|nr:hypothetical protein [Hyphomicrobiales bacterium]
RKRCSLIIAHETRVAHDVCGKYGCWSTLQKLSFRQEITFHPGINLRRCRDRPNFRLWHFSDMPDPPQNARS